MRYGADGELVELQRIAYRVNYIMRHEPALDRKSAGINQRPVSLAMIARKFNGPEPSSANALRQRVGNQGVQRLMSEIIGHSKSSAQTRSPAIQTKLTVGQAGDIHEQEADRVADAVMRMPEPEASQSSRAPMTTRAAVVQRRWP